MTGNLTENPRVTMGRDPPAAQSFGRRVALLLTPLPAAQYVVVAVLVRGCVRVVIVLVVVYVLVVYVQVAQPIPCRCSYIWRL